MLRFAGEIVDSGDYKREFDEREIASMEPKAIGH
jgi:hypothetical protein